MTPRRVGGLRKHPHGRVDQLEDRYLGMVEAPSSNLGTSTTNDVSMIRQRQWWPCCHKLATQRFGQVCWLGTSTPSPIEELQRSGQCCQNRFTAHRLGLRLDGIKMFGSSSFDWPRCLERVYPQSDAKASVHPVRCRQFLQLSYDGEASSRASSGSST